MKFILCSLQSRRWIQGEVLTEMFNIAAEGEEGSSNEIMRCWAQEKVPLRPKHN